jgi:hypothetical protein
LRTCRMHLDCSAAIRLLSEIEIDILFPEEKLDERALIQTMPMWDRSSWPLRRE